MPRTRVGRDRLALGRHAVTTGFATARSAYAIEPKPSDLEPYRAMVPINFNRFGGVWSGLVGSAAARYQAVVSPYVTTADGTIDGTVSGVPAHLPLSPSPADSIEQKGYFKWINLTGFTIGSSDGFRTGDVVYMDSAMITLHLFGNPSAPDTDASPAFNTITRVSVIRAAKRETQSLNGSARSLDTDTIPSDNTPMTLPGFPPFGITSACRLDCPHDPWRWDVLYDDAFVLTPWVGDEMFRADVTPFTEATSLSRSASSSYKQLNIRLDLGRWKHTYTDDSPPNSGSAGAIPNALLPGGGWQCENPLLLVLSSVDMVGNNTGTAPEGPETAKRAAGVGVLGYAVVQYLG